MTNEKVIEIIECALAEVEWDYPLEYSIVFDKAIEALEFQQKYSELVEKVVKIIKEKTGEGKLEEYRILTNQDSKKYDELLEKQIPKKVNTNIAINVKAFDGENKVETYKCVPCPVCGK